MISHLMGLVGEWMHHGRDRGTGVHALVLDGHMHMSHHLGGSQHNPSASDACYAFIAREMTWDSLPLTATRQTEFWLASHLGLSLVGGVSRCNIFCNILSCSRSFGVLGFLGQVYKGQVFLECRNYSQESLFNPLLWYSMVLGASQANPTQFGYGGRFVNLNDSESGFRTGSVIALNR